ncbi:protein-L-isoaspartate(D-aspartate) O-methyltransferase [Geomicrobium halophilum]|uniref:Protein-L-isoaspartate O-methyltransferase n=1 Tax=Geomicrobium halophilum TaxID=549000 RepID=A0A841PN29_9BACL|nr:protein-L-isoaspartate(D-aspartate) O-methyltransferase [Geomicrobium halophilum]MBB6449154.1 protein-L-isoaspartate(D-aspartate) O-methyltransferase [Geomicrobium halophilum]
MSNQEKEIKNYFDYVDRSFYMDKNKEMARQNHAISIGHGQTISQPSLVLKMTLALDLQPESNVLEIGTGSGFQTDILATFSDSVYTVERIKPLQERAKEKLEARNISNVQFKLGDGSVGWKEYAPYDRIMVTAAASEVPDELIEQLSNKGKMLIPIGSSFDQDLTLIHKDEDGKITSEFIEKVVFVRLHGKYD